MTTDSTTRATRGGKAKSDVKLLVAMTGKASPAKAAPGNGPVFAYITSLPQPQRGIAEHIDALAAEQLPDLRRAVKWGMAYYGVDGGWCFSSGAFVGHVKLMFIRGTELEPEPPVTPVGMGKSTRGFELASVENLDERLAASWMKQAAAMPFLGGRSKGARHVDEVPLLHVRNCSRYLGDKQEVAMKFNSILIGSEDPKRLAEYYTKLFGEPAMSDGTYVGWKIGEGFIAVGPHDQVKGRNVQPGRLIWNIESADVKGDFAKLEAAGARIVREPYSLGDPPTWIATLADPDDNYFQLMTAM